MFKDLNLKTRIYLYLIYLLAALSIFYIFQKYYGSLSSVNYIDVAFFALLAVVSESLQVTFNNISISTGFTVTLASVLLFNPFAAIIIVSAGAIFRVTKKTNKIVHSLNTPLYKTLFNLSSLTLSIVSCTLVYGWLGGAYYDARFSFLPIIALIITFLIVNHFLISYLVYIWMKKSFLKVFYENITMGLINIISMAPLGIIVAIVFEQFRYLGVIVIFGPILLARYSITLYTGMKKAYVDTVRALSLAVEAKDKYTEGHSSRVALYAERIGRKMGFSESRIDKLRIASMLHDIGKIGVPEAILNKPDQLSSDEYGIIKEHPVIGANIIRDVDVLKGLVDIVRYHHERYDGKGYPDGLKENEIPLDSYIISLADAFDAMSSDRPYRKAMPMEGAVEIIREERGKQFNPEVADAFLEILETEEINDVY
jgi:putative nucleotidyltransferase with HDIG domain